MKLKGTRNLGIFGPNILPSFRSSRFVIIFQKDFRCRNAPPIGLNCAPKSEKFEPKQKRRESWQSETRGPLGGEESYSGLSLLERWPTKNQKLASVIIKKMKDARIKIAIEKKSLFKCKTVDNKLGVLSMTVAESSSHCPIGFLIQRTVTEKYILSGATSDSPH